MSNLLSTLISSTNALRAFDQALNVVQNNVSNVSTPGYARQEQPLSAERFLPEEGLAGGVRAGDLISRRSDYAERAVRAQQSALGFSEQRRADLEQVEPLFAPIENAGIPGALSKFFQAFSQVGVNPNSATVRQVILDRADAVAKSFRDTATGLQSAQSETDRQIRGTVEEINGLLARIRDFNIGMRSNADASVDAGLDANLHQTLEQLSGLVDFQALEAPDRSLTILIGGSELAVIGDHDFPVGTDFTNAAVKITNAAGADMTSSIHQGKLGALIEERTKTLPGYLDQLNTLANSFANTINNKLASGADQNGDTPVVNLFTYDAASAASTIETNALQPAELALASAAAPGGSGNALDIAQLATSKVLNGYTFTEFVGNIGAQVGRDVSTAREASDTTYALLAQAQDRRQQLQGVSLDEEAAVMMKFQKGYEASAQLIKVINELTETVINMVR